jgi:hypothetical protein
MTFSVEGARVTAALAGFAPNAVPAPLVAVPDRETGRTQILHPVANRHLAYLVDLASGLLWLRLRGFGACKRLAVLLSQPGDGPRVTRARTLHQVGADSEKTYGWNLLTGASNLDDQPVGVEMLGSVDYLRGSGPFSGFITFTYADGSTLGVAMQGSARLDGASGDTAFAATLGVVGGTGKYAATTGTGVFTGTRRAALGGDVTATFDLGLHG